MDPSGQRDYNLTNEGEEGELGLDEGVGIDVELGLNSQRRLS